MEPGRSNQEQSNQGRGRLKPLGAETRGADILRHLNPEALGPSLIPSFPGDLWAQSAAFPVVFQQNDLIQLSKASVGEDSTIFGAPPAGFTILRAVPCDSCDVLSGKFSTIAFIVS